MPTKYIKTTGKWRGYLWIEGNRKLFTEEAFDTEQEAHRAYLDLLKIRNPGRWQQVTSRGKTERFCEMCKKTLPIESFPLNGRRAEKYGGGHYRGHTCYTCAAAKRREERHRETEQVNAGQRRQTRGFGGSFPWRETVPPPPPHDETWYTERILLLKQARLRLIARVDLGPYEKVERCKRLDARAKLYWHERRRAMQQRTIGDMEGVWNLELG